MKASELQKSLILVFMSFEQALAFERELTPLWGIGDNLLLGAPASSNMRRGEALNYKFSRQFSLSHVEENFLLKNGLEIGNKHDLPSLPAVELASSKGED
ncbi:hypothetical protein LOK49_LG15G02412 [Camellia lanceoleosa]|uniref:Uncharacterized protein n=1 Tax=Camellia lanceoleosa TaxID=1840588 RepID=A0ACC0F4Q2_9ERIC|nr:hypothetical protein LOK49_LG15G02412 [Camellia lanceoleosa]